MDHLCGGRVWTAARGSVFGGGGKQKRPATRVPGAIAILAILLASTLHLVNPVVCGRMLVRMCVRGSSCRGADSSPSGRSDAMIVSKIFVTYSRGRGRPRRRSRAGSSPEWGKTRQLH